MAMRAKIPKTHFGSGSACDHFRDLNDPGSVAMDREKRRLAMTYSRARTVGRHFTSCHCRGSGRLVRLVIFHVASVFCAPFTCGIDSWKTPAARSSGRPDLRAPSSYVLWIRDSASYYNFKSWEWCGT